MLFIADPNNARRRDVWFFHVLPPLLVFVAFMGVTLWSWQTTKTRAAEQYQQAVSQEINRAESQIRDRMSNYQQILLSANGFFQASDEVNRNEWKAFYENYDIPNRYPGLQGIAFAERVPRVSLEAHQNRVRAEGYSDYTVTPVGEREVYVPLVYPVTNVTPANYKTVTGFGFDIATDQVRARALESANASGQATLTGKLSLLQTDKPQVPAFIVYQPLYHKDDLKTVAGYAYAPFTAENFFEGIFGNNGDKAQVGFKVYDEKKSEETLLFKSQLFDTASGQPIQRSLKVAGRNWIIEYKAPDSIVSVANRRNPTATLIAGIIFSALIGGLVLSLLMARTRSLAYAENRELQRAKDDLLSIASHQLRTPATGVKQYIGMLREGYGGKIPNKQKKLLNEAYKSNERQLGIIDEILHVARIDTGRLILQKEPLKIRDVVDLILREQASAIKDRSLTIQTAFPKRIIHANGDPPYVRMAIENIISNAIKYTPEKGTVTIKIKRSGNFAAVSVADTGVGIDKKDLNLLFQKFSRIPNELSRQTAGSGVGLYIAQHIIELHGGTIEVKSSPGKGTTFSILLPLVPTNQTKGKL